MSERRYSRARWRRVRLLVLRRDLYRCRIVDGCAEPATVADHIIPVSPSMSDAMFYSPSNLRAACRDHNLGRGFNPKPKVETPTQDEGVVSGHYTTTKRASEGTAVARKTPARVSGPLGRPVPRLAPPVPARHQLAELVAVAEKMGIRLMPWQEAATRYITATDAKGGRLYREVAVVVARQNGKTALMKPHIIRALRAGRKVMHIAQTRELPREMFGVVADALSEEPHLFPKRRGKTIWPRFGAGQEEIKLQNGGSYRIAAANSGGARGQSVDDLLIDELREMVDWNAMSAAEPTLTMSRDPQIVYLSNAGTDRSVVLNALRLRGLSGEDPGLAYLEWSADPDRLDDDREGWAEASPAMGRFPQVMRELERSYIAAKAAGTMAMFETERLCRWVPSMRESLLDAETWLACAAPEPLGKPKAAHAAVSMDPRGRRASMVIAWRLPNGTIALRTAFDVTGDPIDTDKLGPDLVAAARENGVKSVGFDPMTDGTLARFFPTKQPISGQAFANASSRFVSTVEGKTLRWRDCATVTTDLSWTTRKDNDERGSFEAVRGDDTRSITAALAAVRAVWLASAAPVKAATFRSW